MVKIKWSKKARIDLILIYSYIYNDSKYYASKTINEIKENIDILKIFPSAGRKIPEFSNKELRELIYKSYRIMYNIKSNEILIRRVYHSARLLSKDIIS